MHVTPQMITSAMQLYFTGESLRYVQKFLNKANNIKYCGINRQFVVSEYLCITMCIYNKYREQSGTSRQLYLMYNSFNGGFFNDHYGFRHSHEFCFGL